MGADNSWVEPLLPDLAPVAVAAMEAAVAARLYEDQIRFPAQLVQDHPVLQAHLDRLDLQVLLAPTRWLGLLLLQVHHHRRHLHLLLRLLEWDERPYSKVPLQAVTTMS